MTDDTFARIADLERQLTNEKAEAARLREALRFYANAGPVDMAMDADCTGGLIGGGRRAKDALAEGGEHG